MLGGNIEVQGSNVDWDDSGLIIINPIYHSPPVCLPSGDSGGCNTEQIDMSRGNHRI